MDSWSGAADTNEDMSEFMSWRKPLREFGGRKMGHRSSMIGDVVEVHYRDGSSHHYECDVIGWKVVTVDEAVKC